MDRREMDGGHVSRADEHRVLSDLSAFPNVAAMLAFDQIWKKNRTEKKKRKIDQIHTEQHHKKPGQMQVTEGSKLHEVVILSDDSDGDVVKNNQSCKMGGEEIMQSVEVKRMRESGQEEEEKNNNVGVGIVNPKVSSVHISKVDEYQTLADLTNFPNLSSTLAFKATRRKNRKKKKNKNRKIEIGVQNDTEQHHQKPGQMQVTEGANLQQLVILSDDSDFEVTKKIDSCKMDNKETMQSIEAERIRENSKEEEERRNNVGVGIGNDKVRNGHISKMEEYQMLADLTNFPNLASMLAFEATWRKNRKKKKKNKKRKLKIRAQNDKEQHHQKPEQVATIEAPNLQELVTLPDTNENRGIKNGQSCEINREDTTELREEKKQNNNKNEEELKGDNAGVQSADHKVSNGHVSKADEYKMLMDLTDFPNLAALLAFEATQRNNGTKKKKNKKRKIELKVPNNMADVAKEETHTNTCKAIETTKAFKVDDNPSSFVIADLYLSNSQEDTVNAVEEDKQADSSREIIPYLPKPVKSMDEIVPRKLLCRPRYFNHPESSRVMATPVTRKMQKKKKPCFICGGLNHNVTHCKQVIDCSVCSGRGHLANDCPEKYAIKDESSKFCLRCGDSGHDLFSCSSDYSYDDLKEIRCFVCKAFGHLCCVDYVVKDQGCRMGDSEISQP
ncbi:uncharacterized protein LOC114302311 isoform X2 [Camellia sinensis]|uniref:uncharacterized protein LOC114302311 isoform X2 n=1 Tax=Camellia sinensis TaxID=4442 RepID=UPI001036B8CB|nr:uncharacterized protein LOC114302311 isoform X2 [Camellia sinensis]